MIIRHTLFTMSAAALALTVNACGTTETDESSDQTDGVSQAVSEPKKEGDGKPTGGGVPKKEGDGKPVPCATHVVGDGKTCKADSAWKAIAVEKCGTSLRDISYASDCRGGSTVAKFTCCTR